MKKGGDGATKSKKIGGKRKVGVFQKKGKKGGRAVE